MQLRTVNKLDICQDHLKKVTELEGNLRVYDGRTKANLDNFLSKIERQSEDILMYQGEMGRLKEQVYESTKEISNFDGKLIKLKGEIYDKLGEYDQNQNKREEELKKTLKKLEILDDEHSSRLDNNKILLNKMQGSFKKMTISNKSLKDEIKQLSKQK